MNGEYVMNLKLILAGALIAAATPSFAADLAPAPMEPVAPIVVPFTWNGFYVGADIGYSWTKADSTYGSDFFPGISANTSPDANGAVGGLYVGYNAQFNQIVVGLEADAEISGKSGDDSRLVDVGGGDFFTLNTKADENWQGSVRARLGYAIDNFMPYVTGGVAWSDWDFTHSVPGFGSIDTSDTLVGWTVGAGVEYAFTPNLIGRLEYRYTDFGDSSNNDLVDDGLGGLVNVADKVDLTDSTVRVGIAYKF